MPKLAWSDLHLYFDWQLRCFHSIVLRSQLSLLFLGGNQRAEANPLAVIVSVKQQLRLELSLVALAMGYNMHIHKCSFVMWNIIYALHNSQKAVIVWNLSLQDISRSNADNIFKNHKDMGFAGLITKCLSGVVLFSFL